MTKSEFDKGLLLITDNWGTVYPDSVITSLWEMFCDYQSKAWIKICTSLVRNIKTARKPLISHFVTEAGEIGQAKPVERQIDKILKLDPNDLTPEQLSIYQDHQAKQNAIYDDEYDSYSPECKKLVKQEAIKKMKNKNIHPQFYDSFLKIYIRDIVKKNMDEVPF